MDHARRGDVALEAKNHTDAVTHFTAAIAESPAAPSYRVKRAAAHARAGQHALALADAEAGVTLAFRRGKREGIAAAQLRRGIALFHLARYGDAKACLQWAGKMNEGEKLVGVWKVQVEGKLKSISEGDEKALVVVAEDPKIDVEAVDKKTGDGDGTDGADTNAAPSAAPAATSGDASQSLSRSNGSASTVTQTKPVGPPPRTAETASTSSAQTPASKIRHEWYQSSENVYLTLLAKGVPRDQATIDIRPRAVSISFPLVSGSSFDFSLDPLFASIDSTKSSFRILSTKIEITLKKSTPGQKWPSLEDASNNEDASTIPSAPASSSIGPSSVPSNQKAPSYPTSSRSGPKNWDNIVSSYSKPAPGGESKKADGGKEDDADGSAKKSRGDDGDDIYIDDFEDGGDEVNAFFRKLYANASDETKRAMMKSYQESGGTALSTNWDEVKKGPVPVSPPDGMEEKKWEK